MIKSEKDAGHFDKVIVMLNTPLAMSVDWINDPQYGIDAALFMGVPGYYGAGGIVHVITGVDSQGKAINPSGHAPDTFAASANSSAAYQNFGNRSISVYKEGVYVGYKFYETAAEEGLINYEDHVQYPFGYGLSFTTFTQEIQNFAFDGTKVTVADNGSSYGTTVGGAKVEPGKPVIMRLHDKPHTWDALRRLVPDMLAAGFVGCPFICPDMIGGGEWTAFLPGSPFEPELFLRSAQVHALCPMMQISASPWRVLSPEHQGIFKDVVALRQRFAPRFVELAKESARTGEPMMRALEYVFPGRGYADVKDEFLMGDDLLVAPVLEKGASARRIVLPPGAWHADNGRIHDGPAEIEVDAPLARLPHFVRVR